MYNTDVMNDNKNIIDHSLEIQKQIGYLPELNPLYVEMKVYEYLKFHFLQNLHFISSS